MRKLVLGLVSAATLALSSTAANAALTVITCDRTISGGCTAANPAAPAPATISRSDADVGSSPFTGFLTFNNTLAGNYFVSLTTADPNVLFTALTITPITGSGSITYGGAPTAAITLLPGSLGIGSYTLSFSGTTSGGGGEAGTLSFFTAVPEPGTWALMLLRFGGIGLAKRRPPPPGPAHPA